MERTEGTPDGVDGRVSARAGGKRWVMIIKVIELRLRFILVIAGTALGFAYWETLRNWYEVWSRPAAVHSHAGEPGSGMNDVEYYCPMHPTVVQASAGKCPICAMPLSKRVRGETSVLPEGVLARVELSPRQLTLGGVRTITVGYEPLTAEITMVGTVDVDERRLARIASRIKGMSRVESLAVNFTGKPVVKGETLAELYSPELYQAMRELVLASRKDASGRMVSQEMFAASQEKLRLWGIDENTIADVIRAGKASSVVVIKAPQSGVVLRKDIVVGQYVQEGEPFLEIADLSRLWIQGRVLAEDLGRLHEGQSVRATVAGLTGETFSGHLAFIDPVVNPATRTVAVRFDVDNRQGKLRPGMFAAVTVSAPIEAPASPDAAPDKTLTPEQQKICLVTHQELGSMGDPKRITADGWGIWICCEGCEEIILADPKKYGKQMAKIRQAIHTPGTPKTAGKTGKIRTVAEQKICPVTHADLGSMGPPIAVKLGEETVWICCAGCEAKLRAEPARYIASLAPRPGGQVLAIPELSVIRTGKQDVVYVQTEPGVFESRAVTLGPRAGAFFPVFAGLHAGDRIAAAGAFLIDAETRLNPALGASYFGASVPGSNGKTQESAHHGH